MADQIISQADRVRPRIRPVRAHRTPTRTMTPVCIGVAITAFIVGLILIGLIRK